MQHRDYEECNNFASKEEYTIYTAFFHLRAIITVAMQRVFKISRSNKRRAHWGRINFWHEPVAVSKARWISDRNEIQ